MNTLKLLVENYTSTPYPPQCNGHYGDAGLPKRRQRSASLLSQGAVRPPNCIVQHTTEIGPELQPAELLRHNQTTPIDARIVLRTQPRIDVLRQTFQHSSPTQRRHWQVRRLQAG